MSGTQLTVELEPAEEQLIGLCFYNPPSEDARRSRFDTPKRYLSRNKPRHSVQTTVV
jgi:hypothetical protein